MTKATVDSAVDMLLKTPSTIGSETLGSGGPSGGASAIIPTGSEVLGTGGPSGGATPTITQAIAEQKKIILEAIDNLSVANDVLANSDKYDFSSYPGGKTQYVKDVKALEDYIAGAKVNLGSLAEAELSRISQIGKTDGKWTVTYVKSGETKTREFDTKAEAQAFADSLMRWTVEYTDVTGQKVTISFDNEADANRFAKLQYEYDVKEAQRQVTAQLLSGQLWEASENLTYSDVEKFLGVIPYNPKAIFELESILAGSIENVVSPILNLIPGRQPLEVLPGEVNVSWKNLEKMGLTGTPLVAGQVMGLTTEGLAAYLASLGVGAAIGAGAGLAGGVVSRLPVAGATLAAIGSSAAITLNQPAITGAITDAIIAVEGAKLAMLSASGFAPWKVAATGVIDVSSVAGFIQGLKTGQTIQENFPIKYADVEIPLEGGIKYGVKGVYFKVGDKLYTGLMKPSIYSELSDWLPITENTLSGMTDLNILTHGAGGELTGWHPQTPIETAKTLDLMRILGYSTEELNFAANGIRIGTITQGVQPKLIENILPIETKTMTAPQVLEFKNYILENQDTVDFLFGSSTAYPQKSKLFEYTVESEGKTTSALRLPGDWDVQLREVTEEQAIDFTNNLVKRLNSVPGNNYWVDPNKPTLIVTDTGHAVDIHYPGEPELDMQVPTGQKWGFTLGKKFIPIENIKAQTLWDNEIDKLDSILGFAEGRKFMPVEHRTKDIADYFQNAETELETMSRSRNPLTKRKAAEGYKILEEMKGYYNYQVNKYLMTPSESKEFYSFASRKGSDGYPIYSILPSIFGYSASNLGYPSPYSPPITTSSISSLTSPSSSTSPPSPISSIISPPSSTLPSQNIYTPLSPSTLPPPSSGIFQPPSPSQFPPPSPDMFPPPSPPTTIPPTQPPGSVPPSSPPPPSPPEEPPPTEGPPIGGFRISGKVMKEMRTGESMVGTYKVVFTHKRKESPKTLEAGSFHDALSRAYAEHGGATPRVVEVIRLGVSKRR